ncbi:hypothetical protein G6F70_006506 [Rhizopus microsporus]|uniref:non-specific serine/threonine protein kinase n=1 Tax=Rhizopus microsporus TaxID=58291 RepID=A0A1X0S589_RHIZD|nr:hypothetical protein G6F71_006402 [Rhizopus microsporus]KAG1197588.1 hypothetical protein G6F70_006506 [Rhizopus microsporus]KAG1209757.1 hypothetical protein G6F69_006072 [Rhizopus microsporus]KAG1237919.1 hypothetical protein G6F67_000849 [Rhizopus microsporus]KAG1263153.1 hypothetical protein G6F68_005367 [Rhizopus microsporus]
MQVIVPEPYGYPPSNAHSRRSSTATTRSTKSIRDRRRSSGALSTHSQSQKPKRYIGDYIVGKTLGKGASGRVKLGVHKNTGEQVAIKIISKTHLAGNPAIEKAVRREIAIMKLINHPNVMSLIDVIDDPASSDLYLILEYVEGGELFEYLVSKGRLSESEARHHFQQIILGLDYCHHHLICHRDLKPENLLLDSNHNIKIADFGMASLQPLGSLLETSCGSPHYASPEIVAGMPYHGSSCDIWSCGVILFALLTGHLPFDDENIRQLLRKVKTGKYVMPDNISKSAQDLIRRILVVDPSKRLTMKQIMAHPWFKETEPTNIHSLPIPSMDIGQPISHPSEIDDRILETIKFLWGETDDQVVINALLQKEHNMQKVVYVLLQQHAEKYWQAEHDDETDDEEMPPPFPRQYKTLEHRAERDRRCLSMAANKPVAPWVPEEPILRRKSAADTGTEKMKKSETFYSRFVKKALHPRRSSKDVQKVEPTPAVTAKFMGTLRRKSIFNNSNDKKSKMDQTPSNEMEPRKSATISAKRLSLRMPKTGTINSKKFGFTLGSSNTKARKQLDLSMFNEPLPPPPALSDGSTLSCSSSSTSNSSLNSKNKSAIRRSSQASMDKRSQHRPTTSSLLSNSSNITTSPIEPPKPSWLQHLFFFKQPKVCSFIVYSTQTAHILRTLHKLMNKTTETRFYEKCDRTGATRYKAEIKTKPDQGKLKQVKCRIELIVSESDCIVQFTQQQGDGVLLNTTIQQIQEAIVKEYPCPDSSSTLVDL